MSPHLFNLASLPRHYKGVLLDQFGVLHDGRRPYPGAVDALRHLHAQKLSIYVLSNSSQRSHTAYKRLEPMGFRREWITEIVTSGEMTHLNLKHRKRQFWDSLGHRCMHFTWNTRGKIHLEDLELEVVRDVSKVDFILVHGTDALGTAAEGPIPQTYQQLEDRLTAFSSLASLPPMLVANPDFVTVDGTKLIRMPGALGRFYQSLGGEVIWMGKPGRVIYDYTLDRMRLPQEQIVAIGDSLEHDVKGASSVGIDSIFVSGGIHGESVLRNSTTDVSALKKLCTELDITPKYYIDAFRIEKN